MSSNRLTIVCHSANSQEAQHIAAFAIANGVSTELYMHDALPSSLTDLTGHLVIENSKVLLLVSDNYLKSEACMTNGLTLVNELHRRNLLLPVITMGRQMREESGQTFLVPTSFERVSQVIQYMNHWQDAYLDMRKNRRLVSPENEEAFGKHLQLVRQVSADIGELLRMLRAMTCVSYEELIQENFVVLSKYLDMHMPIRVTEPVEQAILNRVATNNPVLSSLSVAGQDNGYEEPIAEPQVAEIEKEEIDAMLTDIEAAADKDNSTEHVEEVAPPFADVSEEITTPVAELVKEEITAPVAELVAEEITAPVAELAAEITTPLAEIFDPELVIPEDTMEEVNTAIPEPTVSLAALVAEEEDDDEILDLPAPDEVVKPLPYAEAAGFMYLEDLLSDAKPTNGITPQTVLETETPVQVAQVESIHEVIAEPFIEKIVEPTDDMVASIVQTEPAIPQVEAEIPITDTSTMPTDVETLNEVTSEISNPTETNIAAEVAETTVETKAAVNPAIEVSSFITAAMLRAQAQAHLDLGRMFREKEEHARAHEHYHCAIAIDPTLDTPSLSAEFALAPVIEPIFEPEPIQPTYPEDNGKIVFITGATSGIGKAVATRFAAEGYRLILTGRRSERLEAIKESLYEAYHSNIATLNFDVRDNTSVTEALATLGEAWQNVDLLINNAGLAKGFDPIHEGSLEHWETMIDTNIKGILHLTRAIAPHMVARKQGHIINIASTAGKTPYPNGAVYCATKAAVDMLTRGIRQDLYTHNIRVSQVSPGHVEETEFALVRFDGDAERAQIYDGFKPLAASDVAETIYFIATRPAHVNIDDVVMYSTQQASPSLINRNGRD